MPPNRPLWEPRDSTTDLLKQYREVLEAPLEQKEDVLASVLFGFMAYAFKRFRQLQSCLPWQPWMAKCFGGVTALGFVGIIITIAVGYERFNNRMTASEQCSAKAVAIATERYDETEDRIRPLESGVAALSANMNILLQSRGLKAANEEQILRAAAELGISRDSTDEDSVSTDGNH